jgi:hypothetical protein
MRSLAGWAIVLGCSAATCASMGANAQTLVTPGYPYPNPSSTDVAVGQSQALAAAAFLSPGVNAPGYGPKAPLDNENISQMLDHEVFVAGQGPMRWSSGETRLSGDTSLRVGMGGVVRTPSGLPLNVQRSIGFQSDAYEVSVVHDWPSALRMNAGKARVDLSPHAGLGMTSSGTSAEAGARVELSHRRDDAAVQRLKDLGVRDGASLGDGGRWYLYAAASGRAVGMNLMHGDGGWDRAGWTTDPTSTLISDAQLGVGWRKGIMQTSVGYVHREVKGSHMIFGQQTRDDSLLAFTLSIKPQR